MTKNGEDFKNQLRKLEKMRDGVVVREGTKVITQDELSGNNTSKAKTFLREVPSSIDKNIYHHIGIYIFKVSILKKFVNLNQTKNENLQNLEQLRAMDNNISIDVVLANSTPIGIDTEEDFIEIKKLMEYKS